MVEATVAGLGAALFGGVAGGEKILSGVDESEMGKGLGKIAGEAAKVGVVFFGEQAERRAERKKAFEEGEGFVAATEQSEAIDKPEGAREKRAFAGGETVDIRVLVGVVTLDETVGGEFALDGVDGANDTRIVDRQKADERQHEETRIELGGAVELGEDSAGGVVALRANLQVNAIASFAPAVEFAVELELFEGFDAAIEGDPGHDLRMGEMPARAANFPNALVGLVPMVRDEVDEVTLDVPGVFRRGEAEVAFEVGGVDDLAVNIELKLAGGGVADADRAGIFVAVEVREFEFGKRTFAGDTVEHLKLAWIARDGALEPIAEGGGFLAIAGLHEGEERECGVAKPAEAIVPVAHAANVFGE